jgi:hypothetical protein
MPSNGTARFNDLKERVVAMDVKLDKHGEQLAEIKAILGRLPCAEHGARLTETCSDVAKLKGGARVSVAKVTGLSMVVAALVSAIGGYFMARGGQ